MGDNSTIKYCNYVQLESALMQQFSSYDIHYYVHIPAGKTYNPTKLFKYYLVICGNLLVVAMSKVN